MINHFVTTLLNPPYSQEYVPATASPWDLYVPARRAKRVPNYLIAVEHALFGDCADTEDRQARAYHLAYLVSGSELSGAITELDSRRTYEYPPPMAQESRGVSLTHCLESLAGIPRTVLDRLFDKDPTLLTAFYDGGTFVDKLAALAVAYVRKLHNEQ